MLVTSMLMVVGIASFSTSGVTGYSVEVTLSRTEQMLPRMSATVAIRIEGVDDALLLPDGNVATVTWTYAPTDATDYVLMVGNSRQQDDAMTVWRKLSEQGRQGQWVYMPADDGNFYTLPRMNGLSMAVCGNSVLALSRGLKMFQSDDQGISWKVSSLYALPLTFSGTLAAIAADANGVLWLVSNNGDVWRGQK